MQRDQRPPRAGLHRCHPPVSRTHARETKAPLASQAGGGGEEPHPEVHVAAHDEPPRPVRVEAPGEIARHAVPGAGVGGDLGVGVVALRCGPEHNRRVVDVGVPRIVASNPEAYPRVTRGSVEDLRVEAVDQCQEAVRRRDGAGGHRLLGQRAPDALCHAHRLVHSLRLDGELGDDLDPAPAHVVNTHDLGRGTELGVHGHR